MHACISCFFNNIIDVNKPQATVKGDINYSAINFDPSERVVTVTFTWTPYTWNISGLRCATIPDDYNILASNCGSCPTTTNHTTVTCTDVTSETNHCSFFLTPTICGSETYSNSSALVDIQLIQKPSKGMQTLSNWL